MALGFVLDFVNEKKLILTQGFEHVKEYAGLAAGKPRVCSEHVWPAHKHPCLSWFLQSHVGMLNYIDTYHPLTNTINIVFVDIYPL